MFNDVRQAHAVEDRLALQLHKASTVLFVEMLVPPYEMFDGKEGLGIMGGRAMDGVAGNIYDRTHNNMLFKRMYTYIYI